MLCLIGHGYIGTAIAAELRAQSIQFEWRRHNEVFRASSGIVINAAGYTGHPNVDACETNRGECLKGNVEWLYRAEAIAGLYPTLHIGSGCVYQDQILQFGGLGWLEHSPWKETDEPNFTGSYYSQCKVHGQRILQGFMSNSWLLRARMPFGREAHPKNLLCKLAAYPKLVDGRNSLTCLEDLAKVAAYFVTHQPPFGVYNATNPGAITTREIVKLMGLKKRWFKDQASFLKTVKAPRSFCTLDTTKLEQVYPIRPVTEALAECITTINNTKVAA